jgi:protein required for attachment to host cells
MLPHTTWVLIADGTQARIYENKGRDTGLVLVEGMTFSAPHGKAQDIMADKPGRAFSSAGTGRSAMEMPTDPEAHAEEMFLRDIAGTLDNALTDKRFRDLVLAIEPRALGSLRKYMSKRVAEHIKAELTVDLVNTPEDALAEHFKDVVPL